MLSRFLLALRFLTRLPVPGPCADWNELGRSAAWFPAAGAVVGALVAAGALAGATLWHSALMGGLGAVVVNTL